MEQQFIVDANILITPSNFYYPVDRVPQYWSWLLSLVENDQVKMPVEVFEEISVKPYAETLLGKWIKNQGGKFKNKISLSQEEYAGNVDCVLKAYASVLQDHPDTLNTTEAMKLGADPQIIASAYGKERRTVVSNETYNNNTRPRSAHNVKIPYVCKNLQIRCIDIFEFCEQLNFHTQPDS
ncbi:hypothetical protein AP064_05500 [Candidatus Liberibacter solanacearum]|uniref:Uncharacterized protein n=1 Tax=Candidatus Liberibacter solanacearum TaxID=556287 RepID=A0A0F4VJN1_9HYPH|nr:DUF4411 family protein [Candidatus Liberibacter solanacearum]KJZ81599.1 hypothetical protein DJ66_0321 [Candidatus Liberibacter solanacearum]KQC48690.1 hypothetical protein AP064_05500 [Candidatus Liberibacter solanacearum]